MIPEERRNSLRDKIRSKFFLIGVLPFIVINIFGVAVSFIEMRSEASSKLELAREYVRNQFMDKFLSIKKDARNLSESSRAVNITPLTTNVSSENLRKINLALSSKGGVGRFTPAEEAFAWLKEFSKTNNYDEILYVSNATGKITIALKNFNYIGREINSESDEFRALDVAYDRVLNSNGIYLMDQALLLPEKRAYIVTAVPLYSRINQMLGVFFLFYSAENFTELTRPVRDVSESMEIYAVGPDYLFRSGSRFIPNAPMSEKVVTTGTQRGHNHEAGTELIYDYRGVPVLSSFSHLGLNEELGLDFDWVLISEIDLLEAFESLISLSIVMLLITMGLVTVNLYISRNFAREITEPLSRFSEIFRSMSEGKRGYYKLTREKYSEFNQLSQAFTSLAETFRSIESSIEQLSSGNTAIELNVNERHPVLKSINSMIHSLNEYSEQAREIADGNYNIDIRPRSLSDRLGHSLLQMTHSLRDKRKSLEDSDWQRNARTILAEIANGSTEIEKMAYAYILFFTEYLGGRSGLFYTVNPDSNYNELILSATFGVPKSYAPRERITRNDGIIGSMLNAEAEIYITDEPGENYFGFGSGLGESSRGVILSVPLISNETPLGAMEILFPDRVAPELINLIRENVDIVAASLARALEGVKIRALLEKTSSQAEELQAQQEELRVVNEEMAEKNIILEDQKSSIEESNRSLKALTRELELKADELQKTNRYKSEFLANMSHELRTPLNSLLLLSSKLEKNRDGNLTERQLQSLRIIHQSGDALLTLINGILDLAKIEAGRMEVNLADTSIAALAKELKNTFQHSFEEKKIDFSISIAPELPEEIKTDPQKLIQVMRNLLANALKFTSQGEVETRFEFYEENSEPTLLITIRDTGAGIPDEKLELIFEAFRQADGSSARIYGGTGLGLTISKEFVKQLSGRIEVESEPGVGSEFRVYLPFNLPVQKTSADSTTPDTTAALRTEPTAYDNKESADERDRLGDSNTEENRKTVLIVEDDSDFAHILIDLCKGRGFSTLYASEGKSGLKIAETQKVDAIILDLKLPDMSGEEVLERLKISQRTAAIPVQIISGKSKIDTLLQKGAIGYLKKPVTEDEILNSLEQIESILDESLGRILVMESSSELKNVMAGKYDERVKIDFADTPRRVMELLPRNDYNCMILDIDQEEFDPFEFFQKIKSIKDHLPPVIIYTQKELTEEEHLRLNEYARFVVLKSGDSIRRLHDESMLFLNAVKRNAVPEHSSEKKPGAKPGRKQTPLKILAIDDDMRNLFALSEELEEEGHAVTKISNGRRALEELRESQQSYDLILTDIMMPEMDGYETMQEIRKINGYEKVPIIALTAKAMKGDRELCLKAGATDYLSKPLNREKLLNMIARWSQSEV